MTLESFLESCGFTIVIFSYTSQGTRNLARMYIHCSEFEARNYYKLTRKAEAQFCLTEKHSRRMRTDRTATRMISGQVAIQADCRQNDTPVKTLPSFAVGKYLMRKARHGDGYR